MFLYKKAWLLLHSGQRKQAVFLLSLMFIAVILESLSIAIIIPLISILLKGEVDQLFFPDLFNLELLEGTNLLYVGLLITLIIFFVKNIGLAFNLWHQTKFLKDMQFELTNRLFKFYLNVLMEDATNT